MDAKLEEKPHTATNSQEENDGECSNSGPVCTELQIQSILAAAGQGIGDDDDSDLSSKYGSFYMCCFCVFTCFLCKL